MYAVSERRSERQWEITRQVTSYYLSSQEIGKKWPRSRVQRIKGNHHSQRLVFHTNMTILTEDQGWHCERNDDEHSSSALEVKNADYPIIPSQFSILGLFSSYRERSSVSKTVGTGFVLRSSSFTLRQRWEETNLLQANQFNSERSLTQRNSSRRRDHLMILVSFSQAHPVSQNAWESSVCMLKS